MPKFHFKPSFSKPLKCVTHFPTILKKKTNKQTKKKKKNHSIFVLIWSLNNDNLL